MHEEPDSDLQAELAALRQRLGNLEAARARRLAFSRKFLLSALPIALLLAAGGVLYAVDALIIDNQGNATFIGKVGIGATATPSEKLQISGGKIQLDGNQQVKFTDTDTTNNLKVQLWSGFGLGINAGTLFYAANDTHSWRDNTGTNEWMALKTGANGGLTVKGTGNSSFAGNVGIGTPSPDYALQISNFAPGDRYIALTTAGGNEYRTGIKLWAWQKDYGFTIENDERDGTNPNGLNILRHWASKGGNDPGKTALFIKRLDGNVGIGTTDPQLPLDVDGWLGSSNSNQTVGGWRLGLWPGNPANQWVYLTQAKAPSYANLAVGDLWVGGTITYKGKTLNVDHSTLLGVDYIQATSDQRLKKDLDQIPNALEKVRRLRGLTYQWNETGLRYFTRDIEHTISAGPNATEEANRALWQQERNKRYKELSKTNIGVIAQDVEAVLHEAVTTDERGYKSVRYNYLIPLLIEAVKEQDKAMKEQAQTVARQQAEIERLAVAQQTVQTQLAELAAVKAQLTRLEATVQRGLRIEHSSLQIW